MTAAADAILAARRAKRILAPLGADAPAHPEAGYAVQHAVAQARARCRRPASRSARRPGRCRTTWACWARPPASFPQASLNPNGAEFRFADFLNPGVECEIGIRLGSDLPAGPTTRAQAAAAVAEVFPAIEIVEKRYGDLARWARRR